MQNMDNASSDQSTEKPATEEYDLVILGGGTGSTVAAWTFASEGKRVAVIERKYIGGSCPNIACLPSKNIIHGAKFILGSGRFVAPRTLEVTLPDGTKRQLRGSNVIISTGTRAALEGIPGLADAQPLTHVEALELDEVPNHLMVIGGGYVGLELAQAMRRFGSKVTVIERSERLLPREDDDVQEGLRALLEDEGIDLVLDATIQRVSGQSGESVQVVLQQNGLARTIAGSHLLVAAGRLPNTAGIGLELAGVELTDRGYLKVNERLQTTAPGVWAIGEVAGSPQFTHISIDDFRVVHSGLSGGSRVTTGRQVPFCLFTDPEFARVGLSEKEAQAKGVPYHLFKVPMEAVLRAITLSETRGFLKALVEVDSDRILGFTAFGVGAGEIMTSVEVAMLAGMHYAPLRDAVIANPTLVEGLSPLFSSTPSTHQFSVSKADGSAVPKAFRNSAT